MKWEETLGGWVSAANYWSASLLGQTLELKVQSRDCPTRKTPCGKLISTPLHLWEQDNLSSTPQALPLQNGANITSKQPSPVFCWWKINLPRLCKSALKTGLKSTLCHSQAHLLNPTPYCFPILLAQPEMETSKPERGKSLWPPPTLFTPRPTHNRILSAPPSQCPSDPSPCYSPVLASPPISTIHLSGIPFSPSLSKTQNNKYNNRHNTHLLNRSMASYQLVDGSKTLLCIQVTWRTC